MPSVARTYNVARKSRNPRIAQRKGESVLWRAKLPRTQDCAIFRAKLNPYDVNTIGTLTEENVLHKQHTLEGSALCCAVRLMVHTVFAINNNLLNSREVPCTF